MWIRRLLSVAAIVAMLVIGLPKLIGDGDVWQSLGAMQWEIIVSLAILAAWNLVSYGFVLVAATPGLTFGQALVVTQSSTAIANTVPVGGAVGVGVTAAMYRSWGFSPSSISLAVVCTGVWNTLLKLSLPIIAVSLLLMTDGATAGRLVAALIGLGVVAVAVVLLVQLVRSDRFARRVGSVAQTLVSALRRVVRRGPVREWAASASRFRTEAHSLLTGRWLRLTLAMLLSHASLFVVFLAAVRSVSVAPADIGWIEAFGIFSFVRLVSTVPVSPGGVGVVELGLSGALIAAGADRGAAVAGVLLFRTLTYAAPVIAGLPAYLTWRFKRAWRVDAALPVVPSGLAPLV